MFLFPRADAAVDRVVCPLFCSTNFGDRTPGLRHINDLSAPAQIRKLFFEKAQAILQRLAITPLATSFHLLHHASALEQEAIALTLVISLFRSKMHALLPVAFFRGSNLILNRLAFPTACHYLQYTAMA